jgi:hypothetical protein
MVSALYVRSDSVYKTLGVDCWDADRDARLYPGGGPVIAHPPCGGWGRYRMCRRLLWERHEWDVERVNADAAAVMCAPIAVQQVQRCGGVLEHPANSILWRYAHLPTPADPIDAVGGFTIEVEQCWWGHRTVKPTWLYVVGVSPMTVELPDARRPDGPTVTIQDLGTKEREATPPAFAAWLIELASRCQVEIQR